MHRNAPAVLESTLPYSLRPNMIRAFVPGSSAGAQKSSISNGRDRSIWAHAGRALPMLAAVKAETMARAGMT
jgi:hypothetical protein